MRSDVGTFVALCEEADRRAMRVTLRLEGSGAESRLTRIALADRDGDEVAATRIGRHRDALERGASALLEYLAELDRRRA